MTLWIDAQLPPAIAAWMTENLGVNAVAVRDLGLRDADDSVIFAAAKAADVTVMTRDSDFVDLLRCHGTQPRVLWLTGGNTSNARLKHILAATFTGTIAGGAAGWWLTRSMPKTKGPTATHLVPFGGAIGSSATRTGEVPAYGLGLRGSF